MFLRHQWKDRHRIEGAIAVAIAEVITTATVDLDSINFRPTAMGDRRDGVGATIGDLR